MKRRILCTLFFLLLTGCHAAPLPGEDAMPETAAGTTAENGTPSGDTASVPIPTEAEYTYYEVMETAALADLLTEMDPGRIASVRIGSAGLGTSVTVQNADEIRAILNASEPLTGTDPVSSRGYYGGNYRLDLCDGDGTTVLSFSTWENPTLKAVTLYVVDGEEYLFESVTRYYTHTYAPMYTVDADALTALNDLCKSYFPET